MPGSDELRARAKAETDVGVALADQVAELRRDVAFLAALLELGGNATPGEFARRRKLAARYLSRRFGR